MLLADVAFACCRSAAITQVERFGIALVVLSFAGIASVSAVFQIFTSSAFGFYFAVLLLIIDACFALRLWGTLRGLSSDEADTARMIREAHRDETAARQRIKAEVIRHGGANQAESAEDDNDDNVPTAASSSAPPAHNQEENSEPTIELQPRRRKDVVVFTAVVCAVLLVAAGVAAFGNFGVKNTQSMWSYAGAFVLGGSLTFAISYTIAELWAIGALPLCITRIFDPPRTAGFAGVFLLPSIGRLTLFVCAVCSYGGVEGFLPLLTHAVRDSRAESLDTEHDFYISQVVSFGIAVASSTAICVVLWWHQQDFRDAYNDTVEVDDGLGEGDSFQPGDGIRENQL